MSNRDVICIMLGFLSGTLATLIGFMVGRI